MVNLEEEEAAKGEAKGTPSKKLEESAGIAREEDSTQEREEEGAQAEGCQRERRGCSTVLGPVES